MADIFLSYASQDRERVAPIAIDFADAGWSVWWDQDIRAGSDWDQTIERELDACGVVVALLSPAAVESRWVRAETNYALEAGKLVPVLLDEVRLPIGLHTVQALNWTGDTAPLLNAVEHLLGERAAPSSGSAPVVPLPHPKPRRHAATAVIALVLAGAGSLYWMQSQTHPQSQAQRDPKLAEEVHVLSDAETDYDTAMTLGHLRERLEALEEVVRNHPHFAPAWASLSLTYRYEFLEIPNRVQKQTSAAHRAAVLDPQLADAQLAMSYVTAGSEKVAHLEETLRLAPDYIQALLAAGFYYGADGQKERAIELHERALAVAPDNAQVHRRYGQLLEAFGGRTQLAIAHIERSNELSGQLGNKAPYLLFQNDLYGACAAYYTQFLANPNPVGARSLVHTLLVLSPDYDATPWIDVIEALGGAKTIAAQERLNQSVRKGNLTAARRLIEEHDDAEALALHKYRAEVSIRDFQSGDVAAFRAMRQKMRSALETRFAPYRTIDAYDIPNATDIWFTESVYFDFLNTVWSMGDTALAERMAEVLHQHWQTPRITNVGPQTRSFQLAWISAMRGETERSLDLLNEAREMSVDPQLFAWYAERYDVGSELSPVLDHPLYQSLVKRAAEKRRNEMQRLAADYPGALAPDVVAIVEIFQGRQ